MSHQQALIASVAATVSGPIQVQQKIVKVTTGNPTATLDVPVTEGNVLITKVVYSNIEDSPLVTSNPSGTTFNTAIVASGGLNANISYWAAHGVGGDTSVTTNMGGGLTEVVMVVEEWSGVALSAPSVAKDKTDVANATVTTESVDSATNSLVVAVAGWTANDYSSGPTNSFTRGLHDGGNGFFLESAYRVMPGGIADTGWTLSAGISWATAIAVFDAP